MNWNQDSAAPEGKSELSIEKLETQLNTLKTMFAEKQKLVADLEVYGAGGAAPATEVEAAAPPAEAAPTAEEPVAAWTNSFIKMNTGQHTLIYFYIYFIRFYR